MRLGLDATPMLEQTSGVPRYCRELVGALTRLPGADRPDLTLVAFSWRGVLPAMPGARVASRRLPARLLMAAWQYGRWPPVELLSGPCDVFHGTNFLSPPTWRAASVVTVHDLAFLTHPGTVRARSRAHATLLPRALRRRRTVVVTPSQAVRSDVIERLGVPADRVVATPLGVDAERWAGTQADPATLTRLGIDDGHAAGARRRGRPYLVFVGTAEPRKNLVTLLAAHRLARARNPDSLDLVIVGGVGWGGGTSTGDDDGEGVARLGRLDEADLRTVVAGSAALVLPSLAEGFGLPILEASAAGRRVMASDLPVLREVAPPDAVFVPALDVDAWASAIAHLPDEHPHSSAAAARRAHAARFTWQECALATVRAYRLAAQL